MTAVRAPAAGSLPANRGGLQAAARLLRLELRHNVMPWTLPVAVLGALALPKDSGGRPLRAVAAVVTPVCSNTAIPLCVNPAYASYLPGTAAALEPVLREIAGLPGAPARISQVATTYRQGAGNDVSFRMPGSAISGRPPVYRVLLPAQLPGPPMTTSQLAGTMRSSAGTALIASVTGNGPGASQAQHAVAETLMMAAGLPLDGLAAPVRGRGRHRPPPRLLPGSPVYAAAWRFATLAEPSRHAWLAGHLTALRAGRITLARVP